MKIIGVTGVLGSGKSELCRILAGHGYKTFSADQISKSLLSPGNQEYKTIVARFKDRCLDLDTGLLDFKKLAAVVFSEPVELEFINSVLHPAVKKRTLELFRDEQEMNPDALIFYESPLIMEVGGYAAIQKTVVVTADQALRYARVFKSRGWSPEEIAKREKFQISQEEKITRADFVVMNNGGLIDLENEAKRLLAWTESIEELESTVLFQEIESA